MSVAEAEFYYFMGKVFVFLLGLVVWFGGCYVAGLYLMHRDYLKDKIARWIFKHIYKEEIQ